MFGLMTKKAHEAAIREVKAAAARDIVAEQSRNERLATEIASLRPDAEKFRAKAKTEAQRKRDKRVAAKKVAD